MQTAQGGKATDDRMKGKKRKGSWFGALAGLAGLTAGGVKG